MSKGRHCKGIPFYLSHLMDDFIGRGEAGHQNLQGHEKSTAYSGPAGSLVW